VVQTRKVAPGDERGAIRLATVDTIVSLGLAFLINAAILILAASVFHSAGRADVADIEQAHRLLSPMLGAGAASVVFALALLASGQNSTITGTLAGQIVMEGFLDLRLPVWLRRIVTRLLAIVPAALVIGIAGEGSTTSLLVLSQVVLSLQLPFAVVPLVMFTGDRRMMGEFASPWALRVTAWAVTAAIVLLNLKLLIGILTG
jgi:manganese transport protein